MAKDFVLTITGEGISRSGRSEQGVTNEAIFKMMLFSGLKHSPLHESWKSVNSRDKDDFQVILETEQMIAEIRKVMAGRHQCLLLKKYTIGEKVRWSVVGGKRTEKKQAALKRRRHGTPPPPPLDDGSETEELPPPPSKK